MKLDIYIHHKYDDIVEELLTELLLQGDRIMATQDELAADLDRVTQAVVKIGTETSTTLQKVADLEAALVNGGMTSPAVDAALAALKAQVQVVDDLIPDAVA
jgi:hypothetical protein